jgi:hypothetical protein
MSGVIHVPPTRNKLTEQAIAELMKADLFELSVDTVGGPAPAFRTTVPACGMCIVTCHAWTEPADDH